MIDEETEHDFKKGASFDYVIALYNFDRRLRLILQAFAKEYIAKHPNRA